MKFPNIAIQPIDHNDPEAAKTALQIFLPDSIDIRAKLALRYLDDTAFIFWYKGKLVVTDESLALTEYEGVIPGRTYGPENKPVRIVEFPRWEGSTLQELEAFLISVTEDLLADEPDWFETH